MNTFSQKMLKFSALALVIIGIQFAAEVEAKTVTQQVDQYRTIRECVNVTSVSSDTLANFDPTDNKLCNSSNLDDQHRLGREIVGVTYEALLYNDDTNQPINDGATGLPVGTKIRVVDNTNDGDIYHIVVISEYISGMSAGSGWVSASPRAFWTANAEGVADWCTSSDSVSYNRYFHLSARKPTPTIYGNTSNVTCNNLTKICTVNNVGPISIEVRYPSTYGNYYARQRSASNVCYGNNFRHLDPSIQFSQQSILFTLNNTGGSFNNSSCSGISANSASGYTVTAGSTFNPTIYMVNTGNEAWVSSSYRLHSVNPNYNSTWGTNTVGLPRSPIASVNGIAGTAGCGGCTNPNPTVAFNGSFTAPTTDGVYPFAWRMVKSGTFFGDTCEVNYTVTGGYSCDPINPANSTYHTGDTSGLSSDTASTYSVVNTGAKCQYFCDSGYNYDSGTGQCLSTPEPTVSITANPTSITSGNSVTLTWSSTDATSCIATGGWSGSKSTSGSQALSPTSNTTYTLQCFGPGGDNTNSVSVTVTTPPPANPPTNISANPGSCDSGTINLSWNSVSGATTYDIRDGSTVVASVGGTSYSHTGLADGSSHSYTIRATNAGGSSVYSSPAVTANAPIDCATLNGVDLVSLSPAVNVGTNSDGVEGTYDGTTFNVLMLMENNGLGTLPAGSNVSYVATIDYDNYWPNANDASSVGYFNGQLSSGEQSGTLTRSFTNDVPFGTHTVCGRVNLDGSPNYSEFPADPTNNTECTTIDVPVPEPPLSITSSKSLVRSGETATISWTAQTSYPLNCTVQGPAGIYSTFDASSNAPSQYSDSDVTAAINNSSEFVIRCTEPHTGQTFETNTLVEVVPDYQEI